MSFYNQYKCILTLSYCISSLKGDLVNGEFDIAVAGMTMTSEREEVRLNQIIFTICVGQTTYQRNLNVKAIIKNNINFYLFLGCRFCSPLF